ncbi:hypothetical protein P154DRAFT_535140 [Amniculicola lignicola CBS 123094]|uniref:Uncharacterized protein n=1 Tax=Amniculicola lignicola CBS 123094 TaxID=1392246 RepID=A0A6A5WFQ6_9PLEO|nr:hypothetical protein P154DRAFT_535140 [Amniculicola lignicola CBS 123094]
MANKLPAAVMLSMLAFAAMANPLSSKDSILEFEFFNQTSVDARAVPYAPGRCSFHGIVRRECLGSPESEWHTATYLAIPAIVDNSKNPVIKPAHGLHVPTNKELWRIYGLNEQLQAIWGRKMVIYRYDDCEWNSKKPRSSRDCSDCGNGHWTAGDLKCSERKLHNVRYSDMDCSFNC